MEKYIDNEQESVNKTFKGEKKKLSQMTFGQKLEYIFEYYKVHMIIALIVLIVLGWCIHHAMTYVQYKFYGMVINSDQYSTEVEAQMHDILGMEKHDGFSITADLYTDDTANMGGYGNKLDIYVMAGQMDFAFADEEGVEHMVQLGAIRDIKDTAPADILKLWQDQGRLYNMEVTDDDGVTGSYDVAVDISDSPIHEYFGLDENTKYLMVADLSGSEEYLERFYELLYKLEIGE